LANTVMSEAVAALNPAIVIAVGQAGGRCDISLERVAINIDDAPIPDNRQQQLTDQPVVAGGPAAYFATLPVKAIVQQLRAAGLPASVSQSAGTFVCNHVFYGLMHLAAQRAPTSTLRAGFIHIPFLPQQAASRSGAPSMAAEQVIEGLRIAVRTTLSVVTDVVVREGALH